jgi:hypothetical protein
MVGFLVVLLFPPTVGLVTYAILRLFWNRDVLATIGPPRRRKSNVFEGAKKRLRIMRHNIPEGLSEWGRRRKFSSLGIFVRAEERFWIMRCNFARGLSGSSRDRAILLLVLGVIGGFVIGWYLPSY